MAQIPTISFTELNKLNSKQRRELKSCEVTVDGEYHGTWILPQTDYVRGLAERAGLLSNTVGGKELEEILHPPVEETEVQEELAKETDSPVKVS